MNECAENAKPASDTGGEDVNLNREETPAAAADTKSSAEILWNQFLKSIAQQQTTGRIRKYPNPDVPEFYPRNFARRSKNGQSSGESRTPNTVQKNVPALESNDTLVSRANQNASDLQTLTRPESNMKLFTRIAEQPDMLRGITRYYWTLHDLTPEYIPRCLNFSFNSPAMLAARASPALEYGPLPNRTCTRPADELAIELNKKNQQLTHLNNVVKGLLDEILRINELSTRFKNKEEWKNDVSFAVEEFLKPSKELGFHCNDCCDRLKDFIVRVSKQLERKISKQQTQYKNNFLECVLSVVQNSLQTLTRCTNEDDFRSKLLKQDAHTQTVDHCGGDDSFGRRQTYRPEGRKNKLQITKIYRNRNFYRGYDVRGHQENSNWYPGAVTETGRMRRPAGVFTISRSYCNDATQTSGDGQNQINPIQLVHQKYKNLNCRLEGIPDKNLVKFSYIVNGKEYSAIASTKKEAQYHCAWHVLGASSQK